MLVHAGLALGSSSRSKAENSTNVDFRARNEAERSPLSSSAHTSPLYKKRYFIVDSGASSHFIAKKDLTRAERRAIRRIPVRASFQSANGVISTNEVVDLFSKDLGIQVQAYVVKDSPPLISLGKIIKDFQLKYEWDESRGPMIQRPDGKWIKCSEVQNVPTIAATLDFVANATDDDGNVLSEQSHSSEPNTPIPTPPSEPSREKEADFVPAGQRSDPSSPETAIPKMKPKKPRKPRTRVKSKIISSSNGHHNV